MTTEGGGKRKCELDTETKEPLLTRVCTPNDLCTFIYKSYKKRFFPSSPFQSPRCPFLCKYIEGSVHIGRNILKYLQENLIGAGSLINRLCTPFFWEKFCTYVLRFFMKSCQLTNNLRVRQSTVLGQHDNDIVFLVKLYYPMRH